MKRISIEILNSKLERIRESCQTPDHRKSFNNYRRMYNKIVGEWFTQVMWYVYFPSAISIALIIVIILACAAAPICNSMAKHF